MTLEEILRAANVKDEVIAGLPKEVTSALSGFASEAATKFASAEQAEANARLTLERAGVEKQEIEEYVERYGENLTKLANAEAQNKALTSYVESLKVQGFDVKIPGAEPVVPGSPAKGANAVDFDPQKFAGQVGSVIAQVVDANNEHFRLTGQPLPDSIETIAEEARVSRKPVKQYVEEKYKFSDIRASKTKADRQKEIDDAVKAAREDERRKVAEATGGNPMLRPGLASAHSFIKKPTHEEIQAAAGNVPRRERMERLRAKIHQDMAKQQSA